MNHLADSAQEQALPFRNELRRAFVCSLATLAVVPGHVAAIATSTNEPPIRFGITPVFLHDQQALLSEWQRYLTQRSGAKVQLIQRASYREVLDLLLTDRIEAAWLCGYPYVAYADRLRLLCAAQYQGTASYRSLLIVSTRDTATNYIRELPGLVFAYSDPLSNSGHLVPRTELLRANKNPEQFFRRSFFTYGHRKVVEAVRVGLADAGAVDGYVFDTLAKQHPEEVKGVRVAWASERFAFPPIVVRANTNVSVRDRLGNALLSMAEVSTGQAILEKLNLDAFVRVVPSEYESVAKMVELQTRK